MDICRKKRIYRLLEEGDGFGTAGTTTTTSLASQGGLLINIDSATGDIPNVSSGPIEDEKYGFFAREFAVSTSCEFDSAVTRTGRLTLKLSTLDATGVCRVLNQNAPNFTTTATNLANSRFFIPCKPSTKYRFKVYAKTNNVINSLVDIVQVTSAFANLATSSTNTISGTTDWTLMTTTFTTNASAAYFGFIFYIPTAGNVSDAWFDINSMTLEEVVEPVANSLVTPSPSLVSFTAVGSTGNIDQSFLTTPSSTSAVGNAGGLQYMKSQSFTPTKSKLTGVYLYKRANVGSPTGNMKIDIRTDNAGSPSSTILATYTIPLATYNAITDDTEFIVNLPCNVTAGILYHIVATNTATEALNAYFVLGKVNAGGYTGGAAKLSSDGGAVWSLDGTADLYFKTLYYKPTTNFKASQNNLSVSVSADEDGFLNGSVINFLTGAYSWNSGLGLSNYLDSLHSAFFRTDSYWNPTTGNRIISGTGSATLIYKLPAGLTSLILNFVSTVAGGSTLEISSSIDNLSYTVNSTGLFSDTCTLIDGARYIKLRALGSNCKLETLTVTGTVDVSSYSRLKNYPTNKDIIKQYSTTLGAPTTSATYRATKWGFPAIEYSATEYQFLDVDTTASGSSVAFSELGTTYTTVADGASLAISSTSNPNIFVKANITANRLYSSSNDFNASSDKDGSLKQNITYQVVQ